MVEPRSAVREILASCLDEIMAGDVTAEACLAEYPAYSTELRPLLASAEMLREASQTRPPAAFRREARGRLMAKIRPEAVHKKSFLAALRERLRPSTAQTPRRRLRLVWLLLLALLAVALLNAGTIYASDAAVPGERLYKLDRTLERLRFGMARDPEAKVEMQLAFADERLAEAQELTGVFEANHFTVALAGYGESIDSVVQTASAAGGETGEGLGRLLDEALVAHDAALALLAPPAEADGLDAGETVNRYCEAGESHPVARSLAEQYEADVEQIMGWFCGAGGAPRVGLGQIMLALRTQNQPDGAGASTEEILERRANGEGWGQIWKDLGVRGKSAGAGPPEHAGPKDRAGGSPGNGPPEHAGPKNKN